MSGCKNVQLDSHDLVSSRMRLRVFPHALCLKHSRFSTCFFKKHTQKKVCSDWLVRETWGPFAEIVLEPCAACSDGPACDTGEGAKSEWLYGSHALWSKQTTRADCVVWFNGLLVCGNCRSPNGCARALKMQVCLYYPENHGCGSYSKGRKWHRLDNLCDLKGLEL